MNTHTRYVVHESLEGDPVGDEYHWIYTVTHGAEMVAEYRNRFAADRAAARLNAQQDRAVAS